LAEERGFDRAPAWRSRRDRELVDAPGTKTGPRVVGLSAVAIDWEKWEGAMVAAAAAMEEAIRQRRSETNKQKRQWYTVFFYRIFFSDTCEFDFEFCRPHVFLSLNLSMLFFVLILSSVSSSLFPFIYLFDY
jgi:hypothetical protein